jgi:hypothetical protein
MIDVVDSRLTAEGKLISHTAEHLRITHGSHLESTGITFSTSNSMTLDTSSFVSKNAAYDPSSGSMEFASKGNVKSTNCDFSSADKLSFHGKKVNIAGGRFAAKEAVFTSEEGVILSGGETGMVFGGFETPDTYEDSLSSASYYQYCRSPPSSQVIPFSGTAHTLGSSITTSIDVDSTAFPIDISSMSIIEKLVPLQVKVLNSNTRLKLR